MSHAPASASVAHCGRGISSELNSQRPTHRLTLTSPGQAHLWFVSQQEHTRVDPIQNDWHTYKHTNWTKTNTMAIGREITGCKVEVDGHNVENVSEAVYLGVKFSEDGRMEGELERRIGIGMSTVGAMKAKVFENRGLSWKAKMQVYNAMVVPMMTYGCESWVLREKEKSMLQATEMSILRKVTGVTRIDHIRNEEIRHRLQQRSIVDVVRERRERWRVKVMEKPESLVERVMVGEIEGRRPRGRPRKRWGDAF